MINCTILVRKGTREKLKDLGKKAQTYDDLINELIDRRESSINRRGRILSARETPFAIKESSIMHLENGKKRTLTGKRFEPLDQQVSGDQLD